MIENILIAIGEERMHVEEITEHAVEIASALGAKITLLRVYPKGEFEQRLEEFRYESADPTDIAKRNTQVREAAHLVRDADLELTIAGVVGNPGTEVVSYVENHDIDHVFIGGRRRSPTGKALMGSTSQEILLGLPVPCTVFKMG
ncbi:universal stress protein [Haloferax sp. DFSO52]|uniref:universal stress protein n=1 Tax=Haloferax sp. DFSO52 TaxID=3388505 RepID=UPI003A84C929